MNWTVYTILSVLFPMALFTLAYVRELRDDMREIKKRLGIEKKE